MRRARPLEQRRFLVMNLREIVMVDDEHTCRDHHVHGDDGKAWVGLWHLYEDEKGKRYGIRCPMTLSADERGRIYADDPPGSWPKTLASIRAIREENERASRRKLRAVAAIAGGLLSRVFA